MPRAIWSGSISFGLLNVPVKLYSAVSSQTIRFNELRQSDGSRIRHKRVAEADGEEVSYDEIVKGYEIAPSRNARPARPAAARATGPPLDVEQAQVVADRPPHRHRPVGARRRRGDPPRALAWQRRRLRADRAPPTATGERRPEPRSRRPPGN